MRRLRHWTKLVRLRRWSNKLIAWLYSLSSSLRSVTRPLWSYYLSVWSSEEVGLSLWSRLSWAPECFKVIWLGFSWLQDWVSQLLMKVEENWDCCIPWRTLLWSAFWVWIPSALLFMRRSSQINIITTSYPLKMVWSEFQPFNQPLNHSNFAKIQTSSPLIFPTIIPQTRYSSGIFRTPKSLPSRNNTQLLCKLANANSTSHLEVSKKLEEIIWIPRIWASQRATCQEIRQNSRGRFLNL